MYKKICQKEENVMYPRIRDMREARSLTQAQIAKILKMSRNGYAKYETGENIPTTVLINLARFYNTSVDYLLGMTDIPKRHR